MELQWPLILFTLFIPWSAGLFATQSAYALRKVGSAVQMQALIVSATLMVIGGIAVFFHLEHWERIFNGFGNITSGITQELIAIVIMIVLMVAVFVALRRSENNQMPAWLAILNIVIAAAMVLVTGHSYMMESRPAWDSLLGPLSLLGAGCILGPATFVILESFKDVGCKFDGIAVLAGSFVNALATVAYLVAMTLAKESLSSFPFYFEPTYPTAGMVDLSLISPFAGEALPFSIIAIIAALIAIVSAAWGKKSGNWKVCGAAGILCGIVSCVTLRAAFYMMGVSVFLYY